MTPSWLKENVIAMAKTGAPSASPTLVLPSVEPAAAEPERTAQIAHVSVGSMRLLARIEAVETGHRRRERGGKGRAGGQALGGRAGGGRGEEAEEGALIWQHQILDKLLSIIA